MAEQIDSDLRRSSTSITERLGLSEGYKTKASCKAGIRSVQKNAASSERFALKEAKNGKLYFALEARNGEVIGTSQMYASKAGRKKGMNSVQRNAADAESKDLT